MKNLDTFEKGHRQILMMTTRSGGEGLNLPMANTVITVCPSFNPSVDLQAFHRVLRREQTRKCTWHMLFLEYSYEIRVQVLMRRVSTATHLLSTLEVYESSQSPRHEVPNSLLY
jgi:SNF2 family DNA or RNA helicase